MIYSPFYSEKFECLAGNCPDTCCARWEIIIDDDTASFYSGLNTKLGEKIKKFSDTDEDGNRYFKLHNNRCPFLDEDNLCEIRLCLGVEHTADVCRQHPWFIEEYEGFTEKALSLSCPAACEIIFSSTAAGAYPEVTDISDDKVLNILTDQRNKLFAGFDENASVRQNINTLFSVAENAQNRIDEAEPFGTMCGFAPPDIQALCSFTDHLLNDCEILTEKWKKLLAYCLSKTPDKYFENYIAENSLLINRALAYFIYRYFLKAVNEPDCGAYARLIALSALTPPLIAFLNGEAPDETFRLFSKEIEHDPENLDLILDFIMQCET
ncbi:MAG: flagellin lysine-N-methylase [Clostridiales bacterium]|nr:flagellin lysine-N-methylase [Clostridiales bacterium]